MSLIFRMVIFEIKPQFFKICVLCVQKKIACISKKSITFAFS